PVSSGFDQPFPKPSRFCPSFQSPDLSSQLSACPHPQTGTVSGPDHTPTLPNLAPWPRVRVLHPPRASLRPPSPGPSTPPASAPSPEENTSYPVPHSNYADTPASLSSPASSPRSCAVRRSTGYCSAYRQGCSKTTQGPCCARLHPLNHCRYKMPGLPYSWPANP